MKGTFNAAQQNRNLFASSLGNTGPLFFLTGNAERRMHRFLHDLAEKQRCTVLALNGMPDHVHLLLSVYAIHSAAGLAKDLKGPSSIFANEQLELSYHFKWQDNYGAFSVSRSHVPRVKRYIQEQKQRHAEGKLWGEWEETFLEVESE